ncbi:exodeoxyribonuclease VII small subunit [Leptolyngbya sp. 7M]|uniref:exodeoxyribonuclease VII small subunit n=1 Tax=Leptolyngbya sp. 7M TaxID=2812896 RepID=UPI001B8AFA0B|nr:exodeoxyribonuclease VII small subunit [Leptolyngbya sp. 7M]QYO65800.1 exodeoxyribonuclease VII small subunit [Leptolyngbya sp. 7M]
MKKTFEQALDELESIVKRLEEGDMPLEESLELFERGVRLSRDCRDRLEKAERRIEMLTKDPSGEIRLEPISLDEE